MSQDDLITTNTQIVRQEASYGYKVLNASRQKILGINFNNIISNKKFRELISEFIPEITTDLKDCNFVIAHYQARPKKRTQQQKTFRTWGCYCNSSNFYYPMTDEEMNTGLLINGEPILDENKKMIGLPISHFYFSVDESLVNTVPTSVVVYPNCVILPDGNGNCINYVNKTAFREKKDV